MTSPLVAALLVIALQVPPGPPAGAWSPTTKWTVHFDEDKCAAVRQFGQGARRLKVDIEPAVMQDYWTVRIEAPEEPGRLKSTADLSLMVAGQPLADQRMGAWKSGRPGHSIYSTGLGGADLSRLQQTGAVRLKTPIAVYDLTLTDLALLTRTLDTCMVDLLDSWGFSKEQQARLASRPKLLDGPMVSPDDYPRRAINQNVGGTTRIKVTIGTDGKARDCQVLKSSGSIDLDNATCRATRRAKFEPARDVAGNPIEAPLFTRITWRIF